MDFGRCPGIRGAAFYADSGACIRAGAAACAESSGTREKGNAALLFGGLPRRAAACNDKKNCMFNRFFEGQAPLGMTARKNESGRSLVEMLEVLAIMGILTIGGVAGYYFAMTRYRANEIIEGVKQRAMIVSSQEKQAPGMPQNLSEFEETILDYKTTAWAGGLNGEENLFTIDVDDVPQAVCQDILIRNWDWPSGIFIYDEKMTDCPEGNVPMAFVFSADLNAQIKAREQNPCYGKGVCCEILNQETHTIRVGEYLVKRICQTAEANGLTCCANPTSEAGCIYDPDEIAKYKPFQETVITCKEDHICGGDDGLICGCKESCGKDQTQDPATCQCTCTDSTKELWSGECLPKCDGTGMTGERDEHNDCLCKNGQKNVRGTCVCENTEQELNSEGDCVCKAEKSCADPYVYNPETCACQCDLTLEKCQAQGYQNFYDLQCKCSPQACVWAPKYHYYNWSQLGNNLSACPTGTDKKWYEFEGCTSECFFDRQDAAGCCAVITLDSIDHCSPDCLKYEQKKYNLGYLSGKYTITKVGGDMTVGRFTGTAKVLPVFDNNIRVYLGAQKIFNIKRRTPVTVVVTASNNNYIRYVDGCEWSLCDITDNGCTDNCGKESFLIKKLQ